MYVINASESKKQEQTFDFGSEVKSFVKLDLTDMSETVVPLNICLNPGEDAFLIPSKQEVPETKALKPYHIHFEKAEVSVKENYLVVDRIQYSTDGKEYSKPWPCPALFQKLLVDRYKGDLYLKYTFEVNDIPENMYLQTEKSHDLGAWMNGHLLEECIPAEEDYVNRYDVSAYVQKGINEYVAKVNWYQSEYVFYALFGENVTESLKNCLVYDTELQPVQVSGLFGVYPKTGYLDDADACYVNAEEFYIGKMPECVTEPSVEGFPFLAGEMNLKQTVEFADSHVYLLVPGDYHMAYVKVNGKDAGRLYFNKGLDISEVAVSGENQIEIRFVLGNRNLMGPHHLKADKNVGISPHSFEMTGTWKEDKSERYHEYYDIKKVF